MNSKVRALGAVAVLLLVPLGAHARNVQRTPEGTHRLVNKDVGDERWVIALDERTGIVTGNVYRLDGGDPNYLWCWPQDDADDPIRLRCQGTHGCAEWVDLGEVELPASFFRPNACEDDAAPADAASHAARAMGNGVATASTLRHSPDTRLSLISKDVGGLRWAISNDLRGTAILGNVFDSSGGPPQFVSCQDDPSGLHLHCFGASGCDCGGCQPSDWTPLPDVTLPQSFFRDRRCPAAPEPRGLVATLRASVAAEGAGAYFESLALSGDVAVAGSQDRAAYFFERGSAGWRETARVEAVPGTSRFAAQVDVSGNLAIVMENTAVRVFERREGAWTPVGTITPPESNPRLTTADIEGDTIAFTVRSFDPPQPDRVHVYERAGSEWTRNATLSLPGRQPFERIGGVDLSGGRIVLLVSGGIGPQSFSDTRKSFDVYERRSGEWVPAASIDARHSPVVPLFPEFALAGEDLIVGNAPDSPLQRTRGAVRWLTRGPEDWSEGGRFSACSPDVGRFGNLVAATEDTFVVGAPDYRYGGAAGDVHVFSRSATGWAPQGRLRVGDKPPLSLALDGRTLLAGGVESGETVIRVFDLDQVDLLPPIPCPEDPPEVWPGEEWSVEPAAEHGMNPKALAAAGEYALRPEGHTHGVVVVRHGVIVAEWYEEGRDATSYGASWSVAKSIASGMIGVAIQRGDIPDENVSMAEYYPAWVGTDKEAITLRHVLQMMSGLEWSENYSTSQSPLSDIGQMASVERDHLFYAANKPAYEPPGLHWNYSSGDSMLFSGVIEAATGLSAGEYARRHLFGPLGMSRAQWWTDAVGHTLTYCCVDAPTREFARFGLLYARNGRWHGTPLLPERWVRDSAVEVYDEAGGHGYGYQWYPGGVDSFIGVPALTAQGFDHQWLFVFPELDLVIMRNGHYDKHPGPPIADPSLFALYPAYGLVPGLGTKPPENTWSVFEVLDRVVHAIVAR